MNWKGCGRKRSWPNFRYDLGIHLDRLRKTTKSLSQCSRYPDQTRNLPNMKDFDHALCHELVTFEKCMVWSRRLYSFFYEGMQISGKEEILCFLVIGISGTVKYSFTIPNPLPLLPPNTTSKRSSVRVPSRCGKLQP
jgi:hypothetical protein